MKKYITGDLLHYKICNAKYLIEVTNTSKHGYCFKGVKDDLMELSVMNLLKIYLLLQKFLKKTDGRKIKMVILMILTI